jgi:hypothetical protein
VAVAIVSCQSSEDISNGFDHQVPDCKTVTLVSGAQTKVIDDANVTKYYWCFIPQVNLETISLPTISVAKGGTFSISVVVSDNVSLRSLTLAYSPWLYSKYINFANPEAGIPLTPQSYTLNAEIAVPATAISSSWLENYYFNDGQFMKISTVYHKLELTVTDTNMNKRIIPIFVKVE